MHWDIECDPHTKQQSGTRVTPGHRITQISVTRIHNHIAWETNWIASSPTLASFPLLTARPSFHRKAPTGHRPSGQQPHPQS